CCLILHLGLLCLLLTPLPLLFFFFNYPAPTETYTLSLHDALPIFRPADGGDAFASSDDRGVRIRPAGARQDPLGRNHAVIVVGRSEEHTSELQSRVDLVCRLLLEKKKKTKKQQIAED